MRIRDTLSGRPAELPSGPGRRLGVYVCGITAYDYSHIGHARTIVVFDVLRRRAEAAGTDVRMIQNFTDVDDKIIERAAAEGAAAGDVAARYMADYDECFARLNVKRAAEYPRATGHIGDMVAMISRLVESGAAYAAATGVYFSVGRHAGYGRLSGRDAGMLRAGARVAVDGAKRDPLDFALWKLSDGEPSWPSPWGRGRPGWHIECSAMCLRYLGETLDLHGGGRDLVFPHHENEMAQSEAHSGGAPLARAWMHVGMVTVGGEKMSKSLGNVRTVRSLLERWSPNAVRMFCLGAHYSKPVDYTDGLLAEHAAAWDRARLAYHRLGQAEGRRASASAAAGARGAMDAAASRAVAGAALARLEAALDDDMNTHEALAALGGLVSKCLAPGGPASSPDAAAAALPAFEAMLDVLGLAMPALPAGREAAVREAVARRDALRADKRYGEADRIRDELASMGVEIVDEPEGTVWLAAEDPAAAGRQGDGAA